MEFLRFYGSEHTGNWNFITPMLDPVEWPLVANITGRILVLDAFSSPLSLQMLDLSNILNRQWTYISHNNPFEDKFEAWSMTAKDDRLYLSGSSHFFHFQLAYNPIMCRITVSAMRVLSY